MGEYGNLVSDDKQKSCGYSSICVFLGTHYFNVITQYLQYNNATMIK